MTSPLRQQIARLEHDLRMAERAHRIMDRAYISTMDPDCVKAALIAIWPNAIIPDLTRESHLFISTLAAKVQNKVRASGVQAALAASPSTVMDLMEQKVAAGELGALDLAVSPSAAPLNVERLVAGAMADQQTGMALAAMSAESQQHWFRQAQRYIAAAYAQEKP